MLKTLTKKQYLFQMQYTKSTILTLFLTLLIGVNQAQAQSQHCYRSLDITPSTPWTMKPNGSTFRNGDIVGYTAAHAQYFMPITQGDTVRVDANGLPTNNAYNAVPLSGMPGLGLVVRTVGHTSTTPLTNITPPAPLGTIISNRVWLSLLNARATTSYTLTHTYRFELVVINADIYKGGRLTFTESNVVTVHTASSKGTNTPQLCYNGVVDPMAALTGSVQVPELPKPTLPSCWFSTNTLNQRVELGPVDPGQITPAGRARPTGSAGQSSFYVHAASCTKGTRIKLYFTDTRDPATPKEYIRTSNPAVGIRLYYSGESETMPFGPAPAGSSMPSRYAPTLGPSPIEGGNLSAPFTVQYVRLPNKTEADIKPGPVAAAATLVIVYP